MLRAVTAVTVPLSVAKETSRWVIPTTAPDDVDPRARRGRARGPPVAIEDRGASQGHHPDR
ncbi:MAG: hypothetical protein JWR62_1833 [Modestobacter sp.]|jgi:hypothetical protein|nr:hypothetical protein [Modestobacter sp.]